MWSLTIPLSLTWRDSSVVGREWNPKAWIIYVLVYLAIFLSTSRSLKAIVFLECRLLKYDKEGYARIGVMPRYGDASSVRWFYVESSCTFHMFNCFEDGDEVYFFYKPNLRVKILLDQASNWTILLDKSRLWWEDAELLQRCFRVPIGVWTSLIGSQEDSTSENQWMQMLTNTEDICLPVPTSGDWTWKQGKFRSRLLRAPNSL